MDSIKDIIPSVIQSLSSKKSISNQDIQEIFRQITGCTREQASVVDFKEGCLKVCVDSSARLYQLSIKKNKILKELKNNAPDVKEISFKVGKTA